MKRALLLIIAAVLMAGSVSSAYIAGHRDGAAVSQQTTFNDGWITAKSDDGAQCLALARTYDFAPEACEPMEVGR